MRRFRNNRTTPSKINPTSLSLRTGAIFAAAMMMYFIFAYGVGVEGTLTYFIPLVLLLAAGVVTSLVQYKYKMRERFHYFRGLISGTLTSFVAIFSFTIFRLFVASIKPDTFDVGIAVHTSLPPLVIASLMVIAGTILGFLISFVLLPLYKKPIETFREEMKPSNAVS